MGAETRQYTLFQVAKWMRPAGPGSLELLRVGDGDSPLGLAQLSTDDAVEVFPEIGHTTVVLVGLHDEHAASHTKGAEHRSVSRLIDTCIDQHGGWMVAGDRSGALIHNLFRSCDSMTD